ncbi:MAG: tetratricopeptide repeat protein [Planctomycetota bacterium]|nr:tetratricopeptide repeat protein [Planctomycetota bacterium]
MAPEDKLDQETDTEPKPNQGQASDLLKRGRDAARAGDVLTALKAFEDVIARFPENSAARFNRGVVLKDQGYFEDARDEFERVLDLTPNDPVALLQLATILAKLRNWPEAQDAYNLLIESSPNDYWALYDRGLIRFELGEPEAALSDFTRALELNPHFVDSLGRSGQAKIRLERFEEAAEDYLDFLGRVARNQDLSTSKGLFLSHRSDIRVAIQHFNILIDELKHPEEGICQAYYQRGLFHIFNTAFSGQHSDSSAAVYDFTEVLERDPNHLGAHFQLARYFAQRLQRNRALEHLAQVIALNPQHRDAYLERGLIQQAMSNSECALVSFSRVIELDPSCARAYEERAQIYREFDENEKAKADLECLRTLTENSSPL